MFGRYDMKYLEFERKNIAYNTGIIIIFFLEQICAYRLKILPMLEEENFTTIGDVEIQFYCVIPTKHVRFHARNLLIEDLSVKEYSSNSLKLIKKYVATPEDDFIDVFLLQMLFAGQIYVLHIKYTTPLRQKAEGLFRSSYIDGNGEKTR